MIPAAIIVRRESMILPRRKGFYWRRAGFVAVCGTILLGGMVIAMWMGATTIGLQIFQALFSSALFAVCILATLAAGMAIVRERVDRTLGLLFLTELRRDEVITGKFAASFWFMVLTVLSLLPLFILSITLGGLGISQATMALVILVSTTFLGCCLGLVMACLAKTERALFIYALIACGIVFFLPPVVLTKIQTITGAKATRLLPVISPFVALSLVQRGVIEPAVQNLMFSVLLGLPLLAAAYWMLPMREAEPWRPHPSQHPRRVLASSGKRTRLSRTSTRRNPVFWRDFYFLHGGPVRECLACGATVVGAALIFLTLVNPSPLGTPGIARAAFSLAGFCAFITFVLLSIFRGSRAFNSEKRNHTLELLMVSDLTEREIVRGKFRAIWLLALPWLACAAGAGLLAVGRTAGLLASLLFGLYVLSSAFLMTALAVRLSIRFTIPAVLGMCLFTFIIWNSCVKNLLLSPAFYLSGLGIFFAGPSRVSGGGRTATIMLAASALVDIELGLLLLHRLRKRLRAEVALQL